MNLNMMQEKPLWHKYRVKPPRPDWLKVFDGGKSMQKTKIDAEIRFVEEVMGKIEDTSPLVVFPGGLSNGDLLESSDISTFVDYVGPKKLPQIRVKDSKAVQQDVKLGILSIFRRR